MPWSVITVSTIRQWNGTKPFFYNFVDIAVVNSFLLHKELVKLRADPIKPLTHRRFREYLCWEMLASARHMHAHLLWRRCYCPRRYYKRCDDAGDKSEDSHSLQEVSGPSFEKNCFFEWHDTGVNSCKYRLCIYVNTFCSVKFLSLFSICCALISI